MDQPGLSDFVDLTLLDRLLEGQWRATGVPLGVSGADGQWLASCGHGKAGFFSRPEWEIRCGAWTLARVGLTAPEGELPADRVREAALAAAQWIQGIVDASVAAGARESHFRSVFESMQDVYYRADAQGRLQFWSPSALKLLGYEAPEELAGKDLSELYLEPSDRRHFLEVLEEKGYVSDYEVTLRRKDGSLLYVATNSRLLRDAQGCVQGVEGLFCDISDRKRSDEALRQSETRYRVLLETMDEGVVYLDPDGDFLFANPAAEAMLCSGHPGDTSWGIACGISWYCLKGLFRGWGWRIGIVPCVSERMMGKNVMCWRSSRPIAARMVGCWGSRGCSGM